MEMSDSQKFPVAAHALAYMAHKGAFSAADAVSSAALAASMPTNPVVVRRVMAGLRDRGFVQSGKGHGGGWILACELSVVTLRDVYAAVGNPPLLAMGHRTKTPECLVEQALNATLGRAFEDAEALLLARFGSVTLAALREEVGDRLAARGGSNGGAHALAS